MKPRDRGQFKGPDRCCGSIMEGAITIDRGATKSDVRQKVWDYMETKDLANFPRPVHHRIPNFKAANQACDRLPVLQEFQESTVVKGARGACSQITSLEFFTKSTEVKVDPDKPLEGARLAALQAQKTLLVPTPRLRTGLFNKIAPPRNATKEDLRICSTSQGVKGFSVPIGLEARVHVDLVVVGSVAVSDKGYRIGKGEGYADMEYAMMVTMGAVTESTVVVTIVHDCQVVELPEELIENHDLTVDYILTPTRIIKTECKHPKPQGIIWSKLDAEMLEKIPVLKKLRALEQKAGKDVALKGSPRERESPITEPSRVPKHDHRHPKDVPKPQLTASVTDGREEDDPFSTLCLGRIPAGLRVSELKSLLRERNAMPFKLTWQGAQGRAFLEYRSVEAADRALDALYGLSMNGHTVEAERARRRTGSKVSSANKGPGKTKQTERLTEPRTAATSAVTIESHPSREGKVRKS